MDFSKKPIIACVHLLPTPGAPLYDGDLDKIYEMALSDVRIFTEAGVDGIIVENFRDTPFYPESLPPETIATLAAVTREIVTKVDISVGVGALRNDAEAAVAIATATQANFVRVNVHVGAVLAEQGIVLGKSYKTLRLREALKSTVPIFADARVKHSAPLAYDTLAEEVRDLGPRAEAIIISGPRTGMEATIADIDVVKAVSDNPVLIGTGITPTNIERFYEAADGFIVGSYFKEDGKANNFVSHTRVQEFMDKVASLRR